MNPLGSINYGLYFSSDNIFSISLYIKLYCIHTLTFQLVFLTFTQPNSQEQFILFICWGYFKHNKFFSMWKNIYYYYIVKLLFS